MFSRLIVIVTKLNNEFRFALNLAQKRHQEDFLCVLNHSSVAANSIV